MHIRSRYQIRQDRLSRQASRFEIPKKDCDRSQRIAEMDKRLTDHRRDRYAQNPNANIDDCGKQTCQNDCSQRIFLFSHFYFPLKRSPIFSIIAESRHHNQHQTEGRGAFGSLRLLQTRSPSQSSQQTSNLFRTRDLKKDRCKEIASSEIVPRLFRTTDHPSSAVLFAADD